MKRVCFSFPWIALLLVAICSPASSQESPFVEGDLIVQLNPGVEINSFVARYDGMGLRADEALWSELRIWLLRFDVARVSPQEALEAIRHDADVSFAQFNHYVTERSTFPNDPRFNEQWALHNTGQTGGTPDADIDAPEAWNITTGGTTAVGDQIVIAVIDGGFDLNHADLSFFKNVHEIPGNGIDDDGNGYIDDYDGWNAYNMNGTLPVNTHGTHVAGIAAARGNNGTGISGVNWGAKVMPIAGSSANEAIVVRAYRYAWKMRQVYNQTNGAQGAFVVVTNSSFGVDQANCNDYPLWNAMYDEMGSVGILSCAATANANWNIDIVGDVPTGCSSNYIISVTNTTHTDARNNNAAYGLTTIDLGAPGTSILSTVPGNGYSLLTGTSMASPTVAGVVALMFAAADAGTITAYKNDPANVSLQFKNWLLAGVDPIAALQGITVTGGRLNARGALDQIPPSGLSFQFINRIEGTTNYGSLVIDNDTQNSVPSGGWRTFAVGTNHVVRTNELPFVPNWSGSGLTEKHHRFYQTLNPDFSLNHQFGADTLTPQTQDANFIGTSPATITTDLIDAPGTSCDSVQLRDPWRYYQDQNGNWLQSNQYITYGAPFVMNNNTLQSYRGVFLNQVPDPNDPNKPYYSVGAPRVNTFTIGA